MLKSGTKVYEILGNQQQLVFLVKIQNGSAAPTDQSMYWKSKNVNISNIQSQKGDMTQ